MSHQLAVAHAEILTLKNEIERLNSKNVEISRQRNNLEKAYSELKEKHEGKSVITDLSKSA